MTSNSLLVSTKPLKQDYWENLPMNTLLAYRDGELVYTGKPHDHEYKENEKKTKYMFLDYANI